LPTPSITGPLQAAPPIVFDAGPLGKLSVNGIVSGMGVGQGNAVAGDDAAHGALSNGQIFLQKTDGWWQFYVQAGAYNILALGTPYLSTENAITDLWGPVPVAYLKLVPGKNTSIQIGALPALMGSEYTFDFENMNIERGLLWNQENSVNRGVQINQTMGKFSASLSWNDGYYSNRYSWLSGELTYAKGAHSLEFVGMGNLGHTKFQTLATPVQNNSEMYALEYTYTKGNWIVQPYWQFSNVPTDNAVGISKGATTQGGAVLVSRAFKHGWSLAGRGEYIASTGSGSAGAVNLLYGPGSGAWSATVTPTYQRQRFFVRGDVSVVRAVDFTTGDAFGHAGADATQGRGVMEVGVLF
jgi:Putative beta-barrel porin-2, OmpL-like. bbp2